MRCDADARQKALKAAAKAEKEANKKKSDLRLAAMRQSRAGREEIARKVAFLLLIVCPSSMVIDRVRGQILAREQY